MIPIDFEPSKLSGSKKGWWTKWSKNAESKTKEIIEQWEDAGRVVARDFDRKVWGQLKGWLLKHVLHGKCAYCETHIGEARQPGHAEHFRPKGGVTEKDLSTGELSRPQITMPSGDQENHPGYFWLAYHWRNLLPSCNNCNTGRGKNNQFPAERHVFLQKKNGEPPSEAQASAHWPDHYFPGPDELQQLEESKLLHPLFDDPRKHIRFGVKGIEAAIDSKGTHSISVYELDSDDLRNARWTQQQMQYSRFHIAFEAKRIDGKSLDECLEAGWKVIEDVARHETPYSAAAEDYIANFYDAP